MTTLSEVRIMTEIIKMFQNAEDKMMETKENNSRFYELRVLQYLNIWEWFSMLVNRGFFVNVYGMVEDWFKPIFIKDYEGFKDRIDKVSSDNVYNEMKSLYKEWSKK